MIVVCAWCQSLGSAKVLREKEPQEDPAISHGICDDHASLVLAEARRVTATERWMALKAS
jgi:hypothetical protein